MKKLLLPVMAILFALFSCDLFDLGQEKKKDTKDTADYSVFFQTNDGPALRFADFDLYDSSTCIFTLNRYILNWKTWIRILLPFWMGKIQYIRANSGLHI